MCVHACTMWWCVFPTPSVGEMRTEGYCFVAFHLTGFLKYMAMACNHLVSEWAFYLNSPENLKLNQEVTDGECIVKTFQPFYFCSHLPNLKSDQRDCDFLIPMGLAESCAEPRPRAFAQGLAGAVGALAQPLPPLRSEIPKGHTCPSSYCLGPWLSPFKLFSASGLKHSGILGLWHCPHTPNFTSGSIASSCICWAPCDGQSEHNEQTRSLLSSLSG